MCVILLCPGVGIETVALAARTCLALHYNCSDNCKDDKKFKETLIEYKAYLMKSGYKEVHIDRKFIPFAVKKKRNKLLRPSIDDNNKKNDHRKIKKYRMVTDYEPTFPDIRVAFRKFKSIPEDDEELKEIFPKGIKHLQVPERRGAKKHESNSGSFCLCSKFS